KLLSLVEELLQTQSFIDLDLFSDAASKRMNDTNFMEELVAYLLHGIQDKKSNIEEIYKKDISEEQSEQARTLFLSVILRINKLNDLHPLAHTRYKQKNDFYTLFNFVNEHRDLPDTALQMQYEVLRLIGPYISPSNEDCAPLREYALNCVSQSNS